MPTQILNRGFRPKTSINSRSAKDKVTTLGDAFKEGNGIHRCHRRRPDRSRAKFSSARHLTPPPQGIDSTLQEASHRRHHSTCRCSCKAEHQGPNAWQGNHDHTPLPACTRNCSQPASPARSKTARDGRRPLQGTALRQSNLPLHGKSPGQHRQESTAARHATQR